MSRLSTARRASTLHLPRRPWRRLRGPCQSLAEGL